MTGGAPLDRPQRLSNSCAGTVARSLSTEGLVLDFGAFSVRLRSGLPEFAAQLRSVYPHFPFDTEPRFVDTTIDLLPGSGLRRWLGPLARVEIDGIDPFGPFPRSQTLPHFEWGVNWAFASMMSAHLLLHSGAVDIDGHGVLLIAKPGSGKSTLTAGLVGRGARLLSDEFGVVSTDDMMLLPMAKPIALKNSSIRALRDWSPEACVGPVFENTRKGNLAHQAVPAASVSRVHVPSRPKLVIFPRYREGGECSLLHVTQAQAFMEVAANSFNYEMLGPIGFTTVAQLIDRCACYRLEYASLQDAVDAVLRLCRAPVAQHSGVPAG